MRVLLLGRTASALPPEAPWDPRSPRWPWTAACGEPADVGYEVVRVAGVRPEDRRAAPRALVGRVRRGLRARGAGAAPDWVQALSTDRDLRRAIARAQVVWSLDRDTDLALSVLPRLTEGRTVLPSEGSTARAAALASLERLLAEVAAPAPGRGRTAGGRPAEGGSRSSVEVSVTNLPAALRPLDAVTEALRTRRHHRSRMAAERAVPALDSPSWPSAERDRSGLSAQRAAADLSLGLLAWDAVDEEVLAAVAAAAVQGSDDALVDDDPALALARLGDAMNLLFHRARHAEVPRSALVDDPAAYLSTLRASRTFHELLQPVPREAGTAPSPAVGEGRPRVLVVTGAYGNFHAGLVDALHGAADVLVRDLAEAHPELRSKTLEPVTLPALATLLAVVRDGRPPRWADSSLARDVERVATGVAESLTGCDVVVADWADQATVWVSHLCPPGVRLVVRVHSLDALDPWLHLVRWDRVERVVVVSEPLRSLVSDLLAGGPGADVPVQVLPHVVPRLGRLARGKTETARTTLGMIGWGRRVKDVHWALDLLERDPSWELVLVGEDFPDRVNPVVEPFVTRLRERLASPALRGRVHRVGRVEDVSDPLRRVGVILSTSVRESWHLGLVEGAASGAVPVVRNWPLLARRGGPRTLFPPEWVVDDLDAAEERVRRVTDPQAWPAESARARELALSLFDPVRVQDSYRRVILDGLPDDA